MTICSDGIPGWLQLAVQEVIETLAAGARPMEVGADHRLALKADFEASFCENLASEEDWKQNHRCDVLKAARTHGAYASALTIMVGLMTKGSMPSELDPVMTGLAGLLVRKYHCPAAFGIPCQKVAFLTEAQRAQVPPVLAPLLADLDDVG